MKMHIKILACRQGLGSATVSVAVGRVPRPTSSPIPSPAFFFGLAAYPEKARRNVFGGTPNTASGTHALPEITFARSDPLKKSKTLFPLALAAAALALNLSGVPQAQAGSFLTNSPMITGRIEHTATLLRNSKVLVAGGDAAGSAELYNPATGTWTATGTMNFARSHHSAVLLGNGQVLVVGGSHKTTQTAGPEAEIFDPTTGKWRLTGAVHTGSYYTTATLLADGKVLVTGDPDTGVDLASKATFEERAAQRISQDGPSTAEIYDPATETWTRTSAMKTAFRWPTATLLRDGQVLLTGAQSEAKVVYRDGNGKILGYQMNPLNDHRAGAELYNPATGRWNSIPNAMSMMDSRFHTTTLLFNGKVLFVGEENRMDPDSSNQIYDPASGTWAVAGAMTEPRGDHTATVLPDGKVLAIGGFGVSQAMRLRMQGFFIGSPFEPLSSAELYDPVSGRWTLLASHLAAKRFGHTATLLPNGKVLIAGGFPSQGGSLSSTELYDPEYDKASPLR